MRGTNWENGNPRESRVGELLESTCVVIIRRRDVSQNLAPYSARRSRRELQELLRVVSIKLHITYCFELYHFVQSH